MKDNEKNLLQTWLDKLQQESWQLELLISGFAIFGLLNLQDFFDQYMISFFANMHNDISLILITTMLSVFAIVIKIFIINLLFHVIVRGLWIGAIGLRYVSGEIDYPKLKYNDKIINYYKKNVGSFDKYIIGLEKIASVVFSFTFLLFFVFISLLLYFILTMLVTILLDKLNLMDVKYISLPLTIFWLFSFGLVAFDFITLGLIKRIKQRHFASFYLLIYRVVGILTLSFLWRPLLLNFLDQRFTKNILIGIVPYILILSFILSGEVNQYEYFFSTSVSASQELNMSSNFIYENSFSDNFYDSMQDDRNKDYKIIQYFSLPSNKIKGKMFEVFVKYSIEMDQYIKHQDSTLIKYNDIGYDNLFFGIDEYTLFTRQEKQEKFKAYIKEIGNVDRKRKRIIKDSIYQIFNEKDRAAYLQNMLKIKTIVKDEISFYIDDQLIEKSKITLDFYTHPNAKEKGMLCFFPIDSLSLGRHTFSYHKKYLKRRSHQMAVFKVKIPFIYEGQD